MQAITEKERGFKAAADLGERLKRLLANKEHCYLGITKYAQDANYREIQKLERTLKAIEDRQKTEEEITLSTKIETLSKLNNPKYQQKIEELRQQLARAQQKRMEEQQPSSSDLAEMANIRIGQKSISDHLEQTEAQLLTQIGLDKSRVIRFVDLENPTARQVCFKTLSEIPDSEHIRVSYWPRLDPNDQVLLKGRFTHDLMVAIKAKKDFQTEFEVFKQNILKTSLINTIMGESNPEIGQFLHLPEIDPTIVWGYDKEIVENCIDQYIKFYIDSFNISIVDRILKEIGNQPSLTEKVNTLKDKLTRLRDYILDIKGVPYENEKEAEQAWLKLQAEQSKASDAIAKSFEELPGWSNWFQRGFRYGMRTLFMSKDILRKGNSFVSKEELRKEQEEAKQAVTEKAIDQCIEDVKRKHQILFELKEIEELIKDQDVTITDHRLAPRWINLNPDVPLRDLGLRDFELSGFIEKHGTKLKCLNLVGQRIDGNQLKKLISFCPRLTQIFIDSSEIQDQDLEVLKKLPLSSVNFGGCNRLTDDALTRLKGMPLTSVNFMAVLAYR